MENKKQLLNNFIFSKNVWTISVAMISIWLTFSSMATMLGPRNPEKVFLKFFEFVFFSFLAASVIIKIIHKILMIKFSFQDMFFNPQWFFVLVLGSLFCTLFFTHFVKNTFFIDFEFFAGIFLLGFVPAGLFRMLINFIISFLPSSKDSSVSIVNRRDNIFVSRKI